MASITETQQALQSRKQAIEGARQEVKSFNPEIQRTQKMLRVSPQGSSVATQQVKLKELERRRGLAKESVMSEIGKAELEQKQFEQEFQDYLQSDTGKLQYAQETGAKSEPVYGKLGKGFETSVLGYKYQTPYGEVIDYTPARQLVRQQEKLAPLEEADIERQVKEAASAAGLPSPTSVQSYNLSILDKQSSTGASSVPYSSKYGEGIDILKKVDQAPILDTRGKVNLQDIKMPSIIKEQTFGEKVRGFIRKETGISIPSPVQAYKDIFRAGEPSSPEYMAPITYPQTVRDVILSVPRAGKSYYEVGEILGTSVTGGLKERGFPSVGYTEPAKTFTVPQRISIGGEQRFTTQEQRVNILSPEILGKVTTIGTQLAPFASLRAATILTADPFISGVKVARDPYLTSKERIFGGLQAGTSVVALGAPAVISKVSRALSPEVKLIKDPYIPSFREEFRTTKPATIIDGKSYFPVYGFETKVEQGFTPEVSTKLREFIGMKPLTGKEGVQYLAKIGYGQKEAKEILSRVKSKLRLRETVGGIPEGKPAMIEATDTGATMIGLETYRTVKPSQAQSAIERGMKQFSKFTAEELKTPLLYSPKQDVYFTGARGLTKLDISKATIPRTGIVNTKNEPKLLKGLAELRTRGTPVAKERVAGLAGDYSFGTRESRVLAVGRPKGSITAKATEFTSRISKERPVKTRFGVVMTRGTRQTSSIKQLGGRKVSIAETDYLVVPSKEPIVITGMKTDKGPIIREISLKPKGKPLDISTSTSLAQQTTSTKLSLDISKATKRARELPVLLPRESKVMPSEFAGKGSYEFTSGSAAQLLLASEGRVTNILRPSSTIFSTSETKDSQLLTPITKQSIDQREGLSVIPKERITERVDSNLKVINRFAGAQIDIQVPRERQGENIGERLRESVAFKTPSAEVQRFRQAQPQPSNIRMSVSRPPTRPTRTTPIKIKLPKPDDSIRKVRTSQRRRGFIPVIRRKGKLVDISGPLSSLTEAVKTGGRYVRGRIAASLRIKEVGTNRLVPISLPGFRPSKRESLAIIQPRGTRLSSLGERQDIQRARRGGVFAIA